MRDDLNMSVSSIVEKNGQKLQDQPGHQMELYEIPDQQGGRGHRAV